MIVLYNLFLLAAMPVLLPYLGWRLFTGKETAESLRQKFGAYFYEQPPKDGIWIHAVSVGETNAAAPLVELLAAQQARPVIFSVSTQTGMQVARSRFAGKAHCVFFPLDLPFAVARALTFFRPAVVIFMETELWPNFVHHARFSGTKIALINGRISDRSYGNYRAIRPLLRAVLPHIDLLLMQTAADAERIMALGALPAAVSIGGNIKFDRALPDLSLRQAAKTDFGLPDDRAVIVFASTHPGEDELFLAAVKALAAEGIPLFPVIAPRHIERAPRVAQLCREAGFDPRLRTKGGTGGDLLLLDTIGELARLYGGADIAVMGGSFIPHGGQNPLEAAAWEVPSLFGPHMQNFREIAALLTDAKAAIAVRDGNALAGSLRRWIGAPEERRRAGQAARGVLLQNRGALEKTAEAIRNLLK